MATLRPSDRLAMVDFPVAHPDGGLLPAPASDDRTFEDGLREGILRLQACLGCGQCRHPAAPVCPYCGSASSEWRPVSGRGRVFSWIRYHRAYAPTFAVLVPYVVVCVQLDEGPRVCGRLAAGAEVQTGMAVRAVAERWPGGRYVLAFVTTQVRE